MKAGKVTVDVAAKMVRHEPEHVTKFIGEVNAGNETPIVVREINRLKRLNQIEQRTGRKGAGAFPDGPTDIKSVLARLIDAGRKWPVALIDPPWQFENPMWNDNNRSPPYPTMTLEQLKDLPVPDIMTDAAAMFLWTTAPKLDEAIDLLRAWGFSYRTCAVWIKDRAVQFSILSRDLEEVVDVEPGAPSGIFDVFVLAGAKQIVGEGA